MSFLEDTSEVKVIFSIFRQDIFVFACFSCRCNFLWIFVQSAIKRLLLVSYRYYLLSLLSLFVMAYYLSQQL